MSEALNIGVRFALYAILLPLFGFALFGLYAPINGLGPRGSEFRYRRWFGVGAALSVGLSMLGVLVMTATIMGVGPGEVHADDVSAMITGMSAGTAWIVRIGGLLSVMASLSLRSPIARLTVAAIGSAVALASLAWAGHGAMDSGALGLLHAGADIVHLLAAGAWLGGLLALASLLLRSPTLPEQLLFTHRSLARFAIVGTTVVALVVATGLVNSWLLIGIDRLPTLWTSLYGRLLLVKLMLFAGMLALAARNQFKLTPALERALNTLDPTDQLRALRISLAIESTAALAILGIVAWLGTLEPPSSM